MQRSVDISGLEVLADFEELVLAAPTKSTRVEEFLGVRALVSLGYPPIGHVAICTHSFRVVFSVGMWALGNFLGPFGLVGGIQELGVHLGDGLLKWDCVGVHFFLLDCRTIHGLLQLSQIL